MNIIQSISTMQQLAMAARAENRSLVLVPTMGFLHDGHLSLLREGRKRADLLVLSIFVNPTQFGQGEDFSDYPRDLRRDSALAETAGVDIIFAPSVSDMYPADYATYVTVEAITEKLCGASRPGHFRGVTTVVSKLFNIVQPHSAIFGAKDFQQLVVIRRMTSDLNLPIEIIGMPIQREADGLAMSSRNHYLSMEQRRQALTLNKALAEARKMVANGERDCSAIIERLRQLISSQPDARIDYVQICSADSLSEQESVDASSVLLLAVFVGTTRLIDNAVLGDAL